MSILAIDQGTSGTKAVVVDEDGGILAIAEVPLRPNYLAGGGVEQDPDELLASVLDAGRQAVAAAGRPVETVALANQGETVLAWDRATGRPLSSAVVWQDRRAQALCRERASAREWVEARTGLVLDSYFSAPKMAWLRRNVTAEGVVTTTDAWLIHRLTGAFVTDVATASRSLLVDVDRVEWDPELVDLWGLSDEALPEIVACDEIVGATDVFGGEAAVAGLILDQQAALFAEACLTAGAAKCTFGTGAFLLANTGATAVRSRAGLTSSVAWQRRGETTYCLDGQVYTAASAVRWLRDLGFIRRVEDVDEAAAGDSNGVLCVPALAGLAAPWWRPDATASFTGLTLSTRPEHMVRAVLEGIASQVVELARLVERDFGAPLTRLRADGGLTKSVSLMQAVADLLQLPVDIYPTAHATAVGAAAFARLALRTDLAPAEAVGGWTPSRTYEPRWSPDRATEHHARWLAAADAAMPAEEKP